MDAGLLALVAIAIATTIVMFYSLNKLSEA
jgi:hypothetical protein